MSDLLIKASKAYELYTININQRRESQIYDGNVPLHLK